MVHNRLCKLFSNKNKFYAAKQPYNDTLIKKCFHPLDELKCTHPSKKKCRIRNIIYFHPLYCNSVKTKVGKQFLKHINTYFPQNSKLHKIFNKSTTKITYSCYTKLKSNIQAHNKKVLSKSSSTAKLCNCTNVIQRPLNGRAYKKIYIYI